MTLMLIMLSIFRNSIKKERNFHQWIRHWSSKSRDMKFWTPPKKELPSPNGATVSHQYFSPVSDD